MLTEMQLNKIGLTRRRVLTEVEKHYYKYQAYHKLLYYISICGGLMCFFLLIIGVYFIPVMQNVPIWGWLLFVLANLLLFLSAFGLEKSESEF